MNELPYIIFVTGASGAGKTTLINELKTHFNDAYIALLHFDSIGVPSDEEMNRVYGSGSAWQKAMTYCWVKDIVEHYYDKKIVILEGQVNLDFIISALKSFKINHYKIVLVHCDNNTRHQRLHKDRNQPELINDTMDSWAEFLKKQAVDKNVSIIDTSTMTKNEMVEGFVSKSELDRFQNEKVAAKNVTVFPEINELLSMLSRQLHIVFGDKLIGIYLFGSLTYSDFNLDTSDIDLLVVIEDVLYTEKIQEVKQLHEKIRSKFPVWYKRLECSYITTNMLKSTIPPNEPRPYYNEGVFYEKAPYGNEWIINNYLIYQYGVPLVGEDFKKLIEPIDVTQVQKACIQDLFQEWEPKIHSEWLKSSYHQSYLVLNLCRILHTVITGVIGTKRTSSEWVKNSYGSKWAHLIEVAQNWKHGQNLNIEQELIEFFQFTIEQVKE